MDIEKENNRNSISGLYKLPCYSIFLRWCTSTKPSKQLLKDLIANKNISNLRKIIFLLNLYLSKIFFLYFIFQKLKCYFIDLII